MAGIIKRLAGPAYLANSATNIYQGAGGSASMYDEVTHMHFCNETSSDVTISIYVGLTGASTGGTTIYKNKTVKANDVLDYYGSLRLDSTDYLVGVCSTGSAVSVTVEGRRAVI